jgi:hypothetical protein
MKIQMTVSQAIAAGYEYYGFDGRDFQHLHNVADVSEEDFNNDEIILLAEKEASYTTIDPKYLAEIIADHMASAHSDETGDDTDDVYEIVKALDFTEAANKVNQALESKWHRKLTDIQLIPYPTWSKSLEEQISSRCIHFTGIMDKVCKAGIEYDSFGEIKFQVIPCIVGGSKTCDKLQFPSVEGCSQENCSDSIIVLQVINFDAGSERPSQGNEGQSWEVKMSPR